MEAKRPREPDSNEKTKGNANRLEQWRLGRQVEQEHYTVLKGDQKRIDQIVRDHLNEDPHYYTKLRKCVKDHH